MTGRIFDIKRYSIHDGPGIRTTVFLKGCGLHCLWCHNPGASIPVLSSCTGRRVARSATPVSKPARSRPYPSDQSGAVVIDRARCDLCGKCADACLYDAMQMVGREISVADVLAEVEKDRIFYEQSGGGVTLSGGDPLVQADFAAALLDACRSRGIRTALDTAGRSSNGVLDRLAAKADLVLYDLKCLDEARHREFTGVSNAPILENLKALVAAGREVWVRIPLVHGVNDDEDNIRQTMALLLSLKTVRQVGLLPYHSGGLDKARRIGQESQFRKFESPSEERIVAVEAAFREAGFDVRRGG